MISAAILGSATFDPVTVDPETVRLAGRLVATRGRGVPMTSTRDVNRDGYPDLVLFFRAQDMTALQQVVAAPYGRRTQDAEHSPALQVEAVLYGTTYSRQRLRAADAVRIVPPAKPASAPGRSQAAAVVHAKRLR